MMYRIHEIDDAYHRGALRLELDGCIQPCAGVFVTDEGGIGVILQMGGDYLCYALQAGDRLLTRESDNG